MAATDYIPGLPNGQGQVGDIKTPGYYNRVERDGPDPFLFMHTLDAQLKKIEDQLQNLFQNANMSDVQKASTAQQLTGAWTAIVTINTEGNAAIVKALQEIARNLAG